MRFTTELGPRGPGCNHIHIVDEISRVVEVMTVDDLHAQYREDDSHIQLRVKEISKSVLARNPNATTEEILQEVELRL